MVTGLVLFSFKTKQRHLDFPGKNIRIMGYHGKLQYLYMGLPFKCAKLAMRKSWDGELDICKVLATWTLSCPKKNNSRLLWSPSPQHYLQRSGGAHIMVVIQAVAIDFIGHCIPHFTVHQESASQARQLVPFIFHACCLMWLLQQLWQTDKVLHLLINK